jgi:hypothetical protein
LPKNRIDVSHAEIVVLFNGDCSTHVNRRSGMRYIDDRRKPAAASQVTAALLHAILMRPPFFSGNFACFDSPSRFDMLLPRVVRCN